MRKAGQGQQGKIIQLGLRLPAALHKKLTDLAVRQRRSLNDQLLWLVERGMEVSEK